MLEPPPISNAAITECLGSDYDLQGVSLSFLPLGADLATAVYRAAAATGAYFVKLRLGPFEPMAALLPHWLSEQGIAEIMAPLLGRSGRPWAATSHFTLLLYPFVAGRDAYEAVLTHEQWFSFGRAIRALHEASLPAKLAGLLPYETYGPRWRNELRDYMAQIENGPYSDPVARRLSAFLSQRRAEVIDLVERTERLAHALQFENLRHVLCHTDLHAGNLLLAEDGRLFIVDWDAPLLAPRERDLMFPGGGQGFLKQSEDDEEALFYAGYGPVEVDLRALAYYRLERIIEDLAIFCGQLLGPAESHESSDDADREQALRWAMSNFVPGGVLEIACRTARRAEALSR